MSAGAQAALALAIYCYVLGVAVMCVIAFTPDGYENKLGFWLGTLPGDDE